MRYTKYIFLFIMASFIGCTAGNESLKVMSFNIRYDNPSDGINSWSHRKEFVVSFLSEEMPDVIGFQEVLAHQLKYLDEELEEYTYVGTGRDDGKESGEFGPVFYKKNKYELISTSQFWLSDTPEVPGSKCWGAQLPRIVTWAKLRDKSNGYIFFVFNAHLSHVSEFARNESVVLILDKIKSLAGDAPVVLTGDFNATNNEKMYHTLTGHWNHHLPLYDARQQSKNPPVGSEQTFHGFGSRTNPIAIDFVFVNGYFNTVNFSTHAEKKDEMFISDHYPIQAELQFNFKRNKSEKPVMKLAQTLTAPYFLTNKIIFEDNVLIPLKTKRGDDTIYYTVDGSEPDSSSIFYEKPIILDKTATIIAAAYSNNMNPSKSVARTFIKKQIEGVRIKEVIPLPDETYSKSGFENLMDHHLGSENLKDGSWTGFNGTNVDIICQLPERLSVNQIHLSVLSDPARWIISPSEIKVAISDNGYEYIEYGGISTLPSYNTSEREQLLLSVNGKKTGKFVKVTIYNPGILPVGHPGAGNPSWLFIDELHIN
ncbi:MAG: endonuclease/exonuclease/phosphatase family protein [Marinilabiliaceae bacterium]|nr:endonuclease/exonuclease/phosphatase family protein [Marinilabiliaceae bacterium]